MCWRSKKEEPEPTTNWARTGVVTQIEAMKEKLLDMQSHFNAQFRYLNSRLDLQSRIINEVCQVRNVRSVGLEAPYENAKREAARQEGFTFAFSTEDSEIWIKHKGNG
jgi:hypothetical protein